MKIKKTRLKNIIDLYIFGNIHVAFASFCLTKITLLEVGVTNNTAPFFVFFATIFSYNVIRFLRVDAIKSWFNLWFKENKVLLYLITFIAALFLAYLVFKISFKALMVMFPFMLFTLLYTFPVKRFSLREKAGLKLFLIAISWAGITVLFPLKQHNLQIRLIDWITFLQRFLFIFAITIPFDIRDLNYDVVSMNTLPQRYGVIKAKQIAILAMLFFLVLEFFKKPNHLVVSILITILSIALIFFSNENRNKYYTSFFIESLPILWFILLVFFR